MAQRVHIIPHPKISRVVEAKSREGKADSKG